MRRITTKQFIYRGRMGHGTRKTVNIGWNRGPIMRHQQNLTSIGASLADHS